MNEVDITKITEILRLCQHFLVGFENESVRHEGFDYATENTRATIVDKKLAQVFNY